MVKQNLNKKTNKVQNNEISHQSELFGSSDMVFSYEELHNRLNNDRKNDKTFKSSKEYFLMYFCKSSRSNYFKYEPPYNGDDIGEITTLIDKEMNSVFNKIQTVKYNTEDSDRPQRFILRDWFMKEHFTEFYITANPLLPKFSRDERTGREFINICKGFIHTKRKIYENFQRRTYLRK